MTRLAPIACKEPLRPDRIDEVLARALSIIRGRAFGRRSTEVAFLRLAIEHNGFEIVEVRR